jgi:hypothetical protein
MRGRESERGSERGGEEERELRMNEFNFECAGKLIESANHGFGKWLRTFRSVSAKWNLPASLVSLP